MANGEQKGVAHTPGGGALPHYQASQFLAILERYAQGENLLTILDEKEMPDWATFWRRCCSDDATDELRTAYERAQVSWATRAIHDVPRIADTVEIGEEETKQTGGKYDTTTVKKGDRLGHRQLRVGTRQWFAERLLAKLAAKTALMNPDGTALAVPVINMTVLPPGAVTPEPEKKGEA